MVKEFSNDEKQKWNKFVDSCKVGDILQFWQWGDVKRNEGWEPYRFGVLDELGNIRIGSQALVKNAGLLGNYLYIPHGPLYKNVQDLRQYLPQLVSYLKEFSKENDVFVIEVEPKIGSTPTPERISGLLNQFVDSEVSKVYCDNGFRHTGRNMQPKHKLLYDLHQTEEEIMMSMKKNTRYNIKLARRKGVEVHKYSPQEAMNNGKLQQFYDSLQKMQQRSNGYPIRPFSTFQKLFNQFEHNNRNLVMYEVAYNGEAIAFNISQRTRHWSSSFYAGSYRIHTNLKAPYLLRWQSVLDAKELGCDVYDFWGVILNSKQHEGYSKNKLSFGGVRIDHLGLLALPISEIKYQVWQKGQPIKGSILSLFRKLK